MTNARNLIVFSFYRFKRVKKVTQLKKVLDKYLINKKIKGTILLSPEGVNGSLSGIEEEVMNAVVFIKKMMMIRKVSMKINYTNFIPFKRLKVRIKKEIVSLGKGSLNVNRYTKTLIHPSKWNDMINDKNIKIVDTRNLYEVSIGKFKNSYSPNTKSFREFTDSFKKFNFEKDDKIALYCTGGIRCEKATAFLKEDGYKNIFQLEGGILNYLKFVNEQNQKLMWEGECFVFDDRVSVDHKLKKGKYSQCYGCRHPLTIEDKKSKKYIKGVSCPFCSDTRTSIQKKNSQNRQKQIDLLEKKGELHPFKKITLSDFG